MSVTHVLSRHVSVVSRLNDCYGISCCSKKDWFHENRRCCLKPNTCRSINGLENENNSDSGIDADDDYNYSSCHCVSKISKDV